MTQLQVFLTAVTLCGLLLILAGCLVGDIVAEYVGTFSYQKDMKGGWLTATWGLFIGATIMFVCAAFHWLGFLHLNDLTWLFEWWNWDVFMMLYALLSVFSIGLVLGIWFRVTERFGRQAYEEPFLGERINALLQKRPMTAA